MRKMWNVWKAIAEVLGDFQFKILFSFLYFALLTPLGVIASFFMDPLSKKGDPKWNDFEDKNSTLERLKKQ